MKILGIILIICGLIWAAAILGGVASHKEGFTTTGEIVPGFVFHAACMVLGMVCLVRGKKDKGVGNRE